MVRSRIDHKRVDSRPGNFGLTLLLALLLLVLAACGTAAQASEGQRANDLVTAGLKAQAAGRLSEATDDYHKALALDPKNEFAYYDLGVIDQQAGRNAAAELEYRTALQYDPNFADALFNLAIVRTSAAPAEAVALYQKAIAIRPNWSAPHLNLGFLLWSLDQKDAARAEFDKAVTLDPNFATRIPAAYRAATATTTKK